MSRITWATWLVSAGLALLAGCGASGGAAGPIVVEQKPWTSPAGLTGEQILTPHYDIRTTSLDEMLRRYLPRFMEAAHAEYSRLMKPDRPSDDRLVIYVFGDRPEWASFTQVFVPAQAYTYLHIHSGGYMDHATATAVLWDIRRDHTLSLIAHEGLHQYLAKHFPEPVPAWLNEGLATQFEDFDLDGPRPTFRPERNLTRKNSLREALSVTNGVIPLAQLLRMDAGDAVTKTGQSTRGYYAQVWSTVLHLRRSDRYAPAFARLLADAGTPRLRQAVSAYRIATPDSEKYSDGEVAFRYYITEDLDTFAADWGRFAASLVY